MSSQKKAIGCRLLNARQLVFGWGRKVADPSTRAALEEGKSLGLT